MSGSPGDGRGRLSHFALVGGIIATIMVARLLWVQGIKGHEYKRMADDQHFERVHLKPHRGAVNDRHGVSFCYTADNPSLIVDTNLLDAAGRKELANRLAKILGLTPAAIEKKLAQGRGAVTLNPKATALTSDDLANLPSNVIVEYHPKRIYPFGSASAHVSGYVGVDQEGLDGIEKQYEETLRGFPGWTTFLRDARGHRQAESVSRPPVAGRDITLSIDSELQQVVAERLDAAVEHCQAKGGYVLVIDPETGDILAMANSPSFDPIWYDRKESIANHRNHATADGIEPGSTIKAFIVAAALEDGAYGPNTPIDCHMGTWMLQGKPITDHEGFGVLPLIDTFVHSSNIAMAQVGLRLGPEKLYHYLRRFGFAERTGIGLGESPGSLKRPEKWSGRTAATVAFGYEIRVSPIQMAMAYAALANKGILMKPRLVRGVADVNGKMCEIPPQEVRRAVSEKTAATVLDFMKKTVEEGTARKGAVDWCAVGGKTGTARKYDKESGGYVSKYYASFVGVAPIDHPRLLCYAVIDEPKGEIYGGSTAAPLFREILEAASRLKHPLLRYDYPVIDVSPTVAAVAPVRPNGSHQISVTPNLTLDEAVADTANIVRLLREYHEAALAAVEDTSGVEVELVAPVVMGSAPDVVGRALREASTTLSQAGFQPRLVGESGVVLRQFPAPGAPVTSYHGGMVTLWIGQAPPVVMAAKHDGR